MLCCGKSQNSDKSFKIFELIKLKHVFAKINTNYEIMKLL